ncbi:hypothetical protein Sru01_00040 [Sphaerisporangium rufum]|uniref:histidine kinase n=1 Tax=Sphaerisporangium rufum TaxID=1381558 RepID=A0A919R158_9ACTN|nr:hypothetical protein Sru01_00040 [Sphaerisporangium rufum]
MPARLTALILVPTLVAVLLAGLRVVSSIESVATYQRTETAARMAGHLRDLAMALGLERDRTIVFDATRQQRKALTDQRDVVDAAAIQVRDDLALIDAGYGARAVEDARQVAVRLDELSVTRKEGRPAAFSTAVAAVLRLHDEIGQTTAAVQDTQLVGYSRGIAALAHAKEEVSIQRGTLIRTLVRGERFTPDTLQDFIAARSRQQTAINTFNGEAGADNGRLLAETNRGASVTRAELTKAWAVALAGRNLPLRDGSGRSAGLLRQWFDDNTRTVQVLQQVENRVAASLAARVSTLQSNERRNAITAGVLILALLLLVLATTILIARSLVRPLRRLRSEALEIAGFRLPAEVGRLRESGEAAAPPPVQPILPGSQDEIGEVATAFDEVHRQALRLAAEESQLRGNVNAMFVNLSRRTQTLVERQISLIDGLERGEQDGRRLADLFKLDHLATRMRRNSENLLVLAGHESARKRSKPAKLVDVVRAALSEVEDYDRVSVKVQRNCAVAGHAANDIVHLVAELVENALAFSPKNTRVVVSSSMVEGGGALLAVSDSGIGMTAEEIAETNRRLADPPVVDVSVSRRMGLFVVGRLALRNGVRVQLRRGDAGGLIAMVLFPAQLITLTAARDPLVPQPGGPASIAGDTPAYGNGATPVPGGGGALPQRGPAGERPGAGTGALFGDPAGPRRAFADPVSGTFGAPTGPGAGPAGPGRTGPGTGPGTPAREPGEPWRGLPGGPAGPDTGPAAPAGPARPATGPATGPTGPATGPAGPATGPGPRPVRSAGPPPARPLPYPPGPTGPGADPLTGPLTGPVTGPVSRPGESSLERGDEYLPIFAAVESAWFRRPDSERPDSERPDPEHSDSEHSDSEHSDSGRPGADGAPAARAGDTPAPARPSWTSTADSGWRAADAARDPSLGGITAAGLPKRTPKANLVPGSAATAAPAAAPPPRPEVSADLIRSRMSRFQQGIQRGRADVSRGGGGPADIGDREEDPPGAG